MQITNKKPRNLEVGPNRILSVALIYSFPFFEWRGVLSSGEFFVIQYDKGNLYYGRDEIELRAHSEKTIYSYTGIVAFAEIAAALGLELPPEYIDFEL